MIGHFSPKVGCDRRVPSLCCLALALGLAHKPCYAELWPLSQFNDKAKDAVEAQRAGSVAGGAGWTVYGGRSIGAAPLQAQDQVLTRPAVRVGGNSGVGGLSNNSDIQFESSFNRLGESQVAFTGGAAGAAIDYDVMSYDLLYRLSSPGDLPLQTFGVMGFTAKEDNSTVPIKQDLDLNFKAGVAIEYAMPNEWSLRGTVERFSGGASFVSAGVVKYIGDEPRPAFELDRLVPAAGGSPDIDGDGVPANLDNCPNTLSNLTVDRQGCDLFSRSFDRIAFEPNSTRLTAEARAVLDGLAQELSKVSYLPVEVQAHTDDSGSSSYNKWLSTGLARAVVAYLETRGVPSESLTPRGYGESRPIASNQTPAGREKNRRVAFRIIH